MHIQNDKKLSMKRVTLNYSYKNTNIFVNKFRFDINFHSYSETGSITVKDTSKFCPIAGLTKVNLIHMFIW